MVKTAERLQCAHKCNIADCRLNSRKTRFIDWHTIHVVGVIRLTSDDAVSLPRVENATWFFVSSVLILLNVPSLLAFKIPHFTHTAYLRISYSHDLVRRDILTKAWQSAKTTHVTENSRDSSVGIATRYGLNGPGDRIPVGGELFRTRPDRPWGAHPASYTIGTVYFPEVERGRHGVDHPTPI